MLMIRYCRFKQIQYARSYTSFLSGNFKNVMNNYVQDSSQGGVNEISQKLSIILDEKHHHHDILQQLDTLRKHKKCSTIPHLTGPIVKQILDTTTTQELLVVLRNPLKYGVFLDSFVSCWLLDHFMTTDNYKEAASLIVEIVKQNIHNSGLVAALSLRCSFEYLKKHFTSEHQELPTDNKKPEIIKVRVKFLRNNVEKDEHKFGWHYGQALLQLTHGLEPSLVQSFSLLGYLLCENTDKVQLLLKENEFQLELLELCKTLLPHTSSETQAALKEVIETKAASKESSKSIENQLEALIKANAENEEGKLIDEQTKRYETCMQAYNDAVKQQIEQNNLESRVGNCQNILDDLKQKEQHLWFFENKDKVDLEIFDKRVYYPKKWFGKKKNVKAIDKYYVPPEISSKRAPQIK